MDENYLTNFENKTPFKPKNFKIVYILTALTVLVKFWPKTALQGLNRILYKNLFKLRYQIYILGKPIQNTLVRFEGKLLFWWEWAKVLNRERSVRPQADLDGVNTYPSERLVN